MFIIDAHCDTALSVYENKSDLYKNHFQLDIQRLLDYGKRVQFFAAFANPVRFRNNTLTRVLSILDVVHEAESRYSDKLSICLNAQDIEMTLKQGKVAALLTVEGGECLNGELSILRQLYRIGVRSMLLAWNHRNLLGDGAEEPFGTGLSLFGKQVIEEMNKLGMIVDVSHLCEASFHDALAVSSKPVIASHSNAKAVCDNLRNLTDHQLIDLKNINGVVGINFYPYFLNNTNKASIEHIIRHIEHICTITGENHIGIGSDYDGIECTPDELESTHKMYLLFDRLAQLNYSNTQIEKLAGLNFLRVIKQILH